MKPVIWLHRRALPPAMVALFILAGCAPAFRETPRTDQTKEFNEYLTGKTSRCLEPGVAISLDRCIQVALENNLDGQVASIQARIATLDREAAFGNFLPSIEVNYSFTDMDKPPMRKAGESFIQASDQEISKLQVTAQMPIFVPQAWFAYDMFRKNESILELIRRRTEQLIRLNITARYYACVAGMDNAVQLQSAVLDAETMLQNARAFEREGIIQDYERAQAEALLMARRNAYHENERMLKLEKAGLSSSMGLSPLSEINLLKPDIASVELISLEDQIYQALLNRLELHISDREIALRKQDSKMAIAAFLPNILGIGIFTQDSDSYIKYSDTWTVGISGFLTLFDGFQNVFEYRKCKEREKEAFVRREQRCMAVILEVIRARLTVDEVEDQLKLVRKNLEAVEAESRRDDALFREGLISISSHMRSISERDKARTQVSLVQYQRQVAVATLMDVIGSNTQGHEI